MESKPMSERSVNETTPLTDALNERHADEWNSSGRSVGEQYAEMRDHARRLERALAVAESALIASKRFIYPHEYLVFSTSDEQPVEGAVRLRNAALAQIEELRK